MRDIRAEARRTTTTTTTKGRTSLEMESQHQNLDLPDSLFRGAWLWLLLWL